MRLYIVFVILLVTMMTASAADLGNTRTQVKDTSHILQNQAWDREGGEDMATAVVIPELPFFDTGATCDNQDDYDVICPYYGSTSADVVYTYTPSIDMSISVDLLGSSYDTKTYVLDEAMNVIACDDDHYGSPGYLSFIDEAEMIGGMTYYIVVDGYGGDCGEYVLNVLEYIPPPPCNLTCEGFPEGEPPLVDNYEDNYNGGCNSSPNVHTDIISYADIYTLCGVGGWYLVDGSYGSDSYRDTDWYEVIIGSTGILEWTVDSEAAVACYLLRDYNCDSGMPAQSMAAGPCYPATMTIEGEPLSVAILFVGAAFYSQEAAGHDSNEFTYTSTFVGIHAESVAVESIGWGSIKSLYR